MRGISPQAVHVPLTPTPDRQTLDRTKDPSSPALRKASRHDVSMGRLLGRVVLVLLALMIPQACWMAAMLLRPSAADGSDALRRVVALDEHRLAVIVPAHDGDLRKALHSLSAWPKSCSHTTLRHVDLVLYYAGSDDDEGWDSNVLSELGRTGGRCFSRTSAIFGNLSAEENVYPKGASVQFYKLFLDEAIRDRISIYQAIAIIEWDVLVAHDQSFEKLHHAAFDAVEPFWVKGSTLAGTNFHDTATIADNWKVLGHINGNAIYNNSDPAFVEFIDFTLARWGYSYSYDVALWATLADFPYSWPIWQRFSSKFVATNLIANIGFLDVDAPTIGNAVASETMFIHGSLTGGGGTQFTSPCKTAMAAAAAQSPLAAADCKSACGSPAVAGKGESAMSSSTSTVCDRAACSSPPGLGGWHGLGEGEKLCGAGDEDKYGRHCRACYRDEHEALEVDRLLEAEARQAGQEAGQHVIMCDTLRPPQSKSADCSPKCATKSDTVCDFRCGSGNYGDYNCNWRDHGAHCRHCFDNLAVALVADRAAKRSGGRVIMCETHEPPIEIESTKLKAYVAKQRVEDSAVAEAIAVECKDDEDSVFSQQGGLKAADVPDGGEDDTAPLTAAAMPYTQDIVYGELCAFTTGYFIFIKETEASVRSLQHFMPGVRVRVAVDPVYFSVFNRTVGAYPDVMVVNATTVGGHASLLADVYCGEGTKLIYYLNPGEVISRTFTKKDTHGTRGDLLVPFTEREKLDDFYVKRVQATTALLGFSSPSFSFGADLILPSWINRRLRRQLAGGLVGGGDGDGGGSSRGRERTKEKEEEKEVELALSVVLETEDAYVPELLAGLAYSQNSPGIWFLNAQQWVTHHMFRAASVWDIPLVKPRFGCMTSLDLTTLGYDVAFELNKFVESSSNKAGGGGNRGGNMCEMGFLHLDPSDLRAKSSVEFGSEAVNNRPMPGLEGLRVSILYSVAQTGDAWLLNATFPTVIENFPEALEVVVVVGDEAAGRAYREVLGGFESTPFDVRIIMAVNGDEAGSKVDAAWNGGGLSAWWWASSGGGVGGDGSPRNEMSALFPLLWADQHCAGSHVLHLDPDSVLLSRVTYDHIFHLGKPVIPFTRFSDEDLPPQQRQQHPGNACWRSAAPKAMGMLNGEEVVHDFSNFDTHVYPVGLYPALRAHLRTTKDTGSLEETMVTGTCYGQGEGSFPSRPQELEKRRRFRREMQFNLMATFMWYRMHDNAHWRAIDPLDLSPDEWLTDPEKYRGWSCILGLSLGGVPLKDTKESVLLPPTGPEAEALRKQVADLGSVVACEGLGERFRNKLIHS